MHRLTKNPIPQKIPPELYSICYDKNDLINKIEFYNKNIKNMYNNYLKLKIEDFIHENKKSNVECIFEVD